MGIKTTTHNALLVPGVQEVPSRGQLPNRVLVVSEGLQALQGFQVPNLKINYFNSIYYYRNTAGINTVPKLRSNKQYVSIVFHALIIGLKLFEHSRVS